ncbi:MAG: hypothetical protein U1E42_00390 [Rhodospirillales bacterium]
MGGMFKSPKVAAATAVTPMVTTSTIAVQSTSCTDADAEETTRRQRVQAMVEQRRGRASTITTSQRGLLISASDLPARKSLLGE